MKLAALRSELKTLSPRGTFSLTQSHLETLELNDLAAIHRLPVPLRLTQVEAELSARSISIRGITQAWDMETLPVELTATEAEEGVQCQFLFRVPENWTLSHTFPLSTRWGFQEGAFRRLPGIFQNLPLQSPRLLLASKDGLSTPEKTLLAKGLNLLAEVDPHAFDIPVLSLGGGLPRLPLAGRLEPTNGTYHLAAECRFDLPEPLRKLGFSNGRLIHDSDQGGGTSGKEGIIILQAIYQFHDWKVTMRTDCQVGTTNPFLAFTGKFEDSPTLPLAEIAQLFGVKGFSDHFPIGELLPQVQLSSIGIGIDTRSFTPVQSVLSLSLAQPWEIIPGYFALEEGSLTLALSRPAGASGQSFCATLTGTFDIAGASFTGSYSTLDRRLRGRKAEPVATRRLLKTFIPADLPFDLPDIHDITFEIDPPEKRFTLSGALQRGFSITLGDKAIEVPGMLLRLTADFKDGLSAQGSINGDLEINDIPLHLYSGLSKGARISLRIPRISLPGLLSALIQEPVDDLFDLELSDVAVELSEHGDIGFSAAIDADFTALAGRLGLTLPLVVTRVPIDYISFHYARDSKQWQLALSSEESFTIFRQEWGRLDLKQPHLEVRQSTDKKKENALSFTLDGYVRPADAVELQFEKLGFQWESKDNAWSVPGIARANILDRGHDLKVAVGSNIVSFVLDDKVALTDLGGAGAVTVSQLQVLAQKEDGAKAWQWGMGGRAALALQNLVEASGQLALETGRQGTQLKIVAEAPKVPPLALPLGISPEPQLLLSLKSLTLSFGKAEQSKKGNTPATDWRMEAGATLKMAHVPEVVKDYFPGEEDELEGTFYAMPKAFGVRFGGPSLAILQPRFPELRLKFANGETYSLGRPEAGIQTITLELGKKPKLIEHIQVHLPDKINGLFGVDQAGDPVHEIFRSTFGLSLEIGEKLGVNLLDAPLNAVEFHEEPGYDGKWIDWKMPGGSLFAFQVPEFTYNSKGQWQAGGGFIRKVEAISLLPLKRLLTKSGIPQEVLLVLPDRFELRDIDLTGDNFYAEMLRLLGEDTLGRVSSGASAILKDLIEAMQSASKLLPPRLEDYFKIQYPRALTFDISVDGIGGGTSFGLHAAEDKPLQLLFPFMAGIPELMGITLRSLSVGQKSGGALAIIEMDGHIDRFDMLQLTLGLTRAAITREPAAISNRYILGNTLLVVPTGFPVPIPLFFDHLGLEYYDALGTEVQAHWGFPKPDLGIADYITIFSALFKFFTEKGEDSLLHKNAELRNALPVKLSIGQNFLGLPPYLGGRGLGLLEALPTLELQDSIARFFDFLKTGNLGYFIQAIPLEVKGRWIRIGRQDIDFGPIHLGFAWCITTDEEFKTVILKNSEAKKQLSPAFTDDALLSLPEENRGQVLDKGFIILLMQEWGIKNIISFQTQFGMVLSDAPDSRSRFKYQTGIRLSGTVANVLKMEIQGVIQVEEHSFFVKGKYAWELHGERLFSVEGSMFISDKAFTVTLEAGFTPHFSIAGSWHIGNDGMRLEGEINWAYSSGEEIRRTAYGEFSSKGLELGFSGNFFNAEVKAAVLIPDATGAMAAQLTITPDDHLNQVFGKHLLDLENEIMDSVDEARQSVERALGDYEVELSLRGMRTLIPGFCTGAERNIRSQINKNVSNYVKKYVPDIFGARKKARKYALKQAHNNAASYYRKLQNLKRQVSKSTDDDRTRTALKKALGELIGRDGKGLKITVKARIPKPVNKSITILRNRPVMSAAQIGQLKTARDAVDALPAVSERKISTQAAYDELIGKQKVFETIKGQMQGKISGAAPRLEAISFKTPLTRIDPKGMEVEAKVRYRDELHNFRAEVDLDNLIASAATLSKGFFNVLAG